VAQFAEALLVIPRTLTVNAAHDATELVSQLKAHHYTSQHVEGKTALKYTGLDLNKGCVRDNLQVRILSLVL